MERLKKKLLGLRRRDEGASAVEYGLLVALIAVIIAVAVATLGTNLSDKFTDVGNCVARIRAAAECVPAPRRGRDAAGLARAAISDMRARRPARAGGHGGFLWRSLGGVRAKWSQRRRRHLR